MGGMIPEDIYEMTRAADPRLSPDGRTVAFVLWRLDRESNESRSTIWMAPVDGSDPPRPFTTGPKRDTTPRWSPDGSHLAFVSERESEVGQLYVMPVAGGGEPRRLTDLKESATEVAWSPDGSRLVFSSRVPDPAYDEKDPKRRPPRRFTRLQFKLDNEGWVGDRPQKLFTVAADGSEPAVQITKGEFQDAGPAWSPDGTRIAFASARHDDWDTSVVSDIYVIEVDDGEPERLTTSDGRCELPSWSPDGRRIAYYVTPGVWDDPRHAQVAAVGAAGGEGWRILTGSLDRNCEPFPPSREPVWDGDRVLFLVEDGGNTHLYAVPGDGSAPPECLIAGDVAVHEYDTAGGSMVHTMRTPTSLSEVYVGDRPLSAFGQAFCEGREVVAPERFTAVSSDGREVDAWLVRPAGFDPALRYPVLLSVHGGPFSQYGTGFFDEFQVYAGAGYAVLFSNPRGSSGYSEEWGRAIRGPVDGGPGWGSLDYEDLMAVVDEGLRRFDFLDRDRLGVLGGSYGGFMASWIVSHTDRFKAAVSERAVNNWVSMWGSSDFGWDFKGYLGSFLFEDPETYLRLSPSSYAPNIRTPVLILHSENDLRCPIEQGEHLFTTLRILKRPVEMVRFPEEGHELSRSGSPVHRVQRFHVILEWFERHLGA